LLRLECGAERRERHGRALANLFVAGFIGSPAMQFAVLEHGHAVSHGHRFNLVMCDINRGRTEAALQRGDVGAGLNAQLCVEIRKGARPRSILF
jgi:ABC-type sugar transport system ATPase subunit